MPMQPAILGTARLGNFRLGYVPAALTTLRATHVRILLAGDPAVVRREGLTIRDIINADPNTCALTFDGSETPVDAQTLRITINSDDPQLLFNGSLQNVDLSYVGHPPEPQYPATAVDDLWQANRRRPFGTWTLVSATTIGQYLASVAGLSDAGIALGLPDVSVNLDGSEGITGGFAQLAKLIGGYFKVEDGVAYLFLSDTSDQPDDIDDTPGRFLDDPKITLKTDDSQLVTRVFGKGHGEALLVDAAVGDPVIRVTQAEAWFNPSGGQVISETQILTYAGVAAVYVPPLIDQVIRTPASAINWLRVVWAPELALFVAVAAAASSVAVMTSPDGVTWTTRTPAVNVQWSALAWSPELRLLVAAANSGEIMTSPDGITWTSRTSPEANIWNGVCWSADRQLFVLVGASGTHRVQTSPDGITWTSRTAAAAAAYQDVIWAPALTLFMAVDSSSSTTAVMTSPDGTTWTSRTTPGAALKGIAWSPALGLLVAVGGFPATPTGYVQTSPDGITWTARTPANHNTWERVLWIDDLGAFVAVASDGVAVTGRRVMSSTDGITWIDHATPTAGAWRALAWAPPLHMIAIVGQTGATASVMTSTVQQQGTLIGIPSSGPGSITVPLIEGAPIHIWVQRDDLAAQADQAIVDAANGRTPADGIWEGPPIVDERRNEASLTALLDATLALMSTPIRIVTYACIPDVGRPLPRSGKLQHFDVTTPPIGPFDLTIQEVTITDLDLAPGLNPRFAVTASNRAGKTLEGLMRELLTKAGS